MFQGVTFRVESDDSQVCSLRFDMFREGFQLCLNLVYLCLRLQFSEVQPLYIITFRLPRCAMGGGTPSENIAYTYGGRMGGRPLPKLSPANSNLHTGPKPLHIDSKPREYRSQPLWGVPPLMKQGFP